MITNSEGAVVFQSKLSYEWLVFTAKTSLHYGGVCVHACVWMCVYSGDDACLWGQMYALPTPAPLPSFPVFH